MFKLKVGYLKIKTILIYLLTTSLYWIFFPITWMIQKLIQKGYEIRSFLYENEVGKFKQRNFPNPTISIGNIAIGGSGKTPFLLWLEHFISSETIFSKSLIVSRGHKSKVVNSVALLSKTIQGPKWGLDKTAENFGDEAILVFKNMSSNCLGILLGKNRYENVSRFLPLLSPDVILLDDGFQHLKIKRDIDIVLIDSLVPLSRYKMFPFGVLREGFSALKRLRRHHSCIILTRVNLLSEEEREKRVDLLNKEIRRYLKEEISIFQTGHYPTGLFDSFGKLFCSPTEMKEKTPRVIVLTALAKSSSEAFCLELKDLGVTVVYKKFLSDHSKFSENQIQTLLDLAIKEDLKIMVTEKDWVKFPANLLLKEFERIFFLGLEIKFIQGENEFKNFMKTSLDYYF